MCGIAGFFSFHQPDSDGAGFLRQASAILQHRGPDDEGFVLIDGEGLPLEAIGKSTAAEISERGLLPLENYLHFGFRAGLMHRRLAIIATGAEGHQPMGDPQRKVWISFNGEIYNYKSLRNELQNHGYRFQTQTDTEVLLFAWMHWGEACLQKLDGMWAFALLDLNRQVFFAACDPAGIKPFYYREHSDGFRFASEIKALLPEQPLLNQHEIARYLAWGQSDESEQTHFEGISRLQGGCCLQLSLQQPGNLKPRKWHHLPWNGETDDFSSREFQFQSEHICEILKETVATRLQADVALGVCLSGGIDSSAIAGLVAATSRHRALQFPAKAFMAILPAGRQPDESHFARQMAAAAGLELHTCCPAPDEFLMSLENMIYTLDAPPPGLNGFSQYALFKLVQETGVRVSLDGQGADELFGGYPLHREMALLENLRSGNLSGIRPKILKRMAWNLLREVMPQELSHSILLHKKPELGIFRPEVWRLAGRKNLHLDEGLNAGLLHDYQAGILPFLLKAADRNSMRWSVESRMPFADSARLAQHLFSLPGSLKLPGGHSKALLRAAVKFCVPDEILHRKDKVGFAAPQQDWLTALLRSDFIHGLPACEEWLDAKAFGKYAEQFLKKPGSVDALVIWRALAFRVWYAVFFERRGTV
jgi:asparagine synthase (glutamine-hydrolysing)